MADIAAEIVQKQHVIEILRTAGLYEVADEAERSLPDQMEFDSAAALLGRYGITKDTLISRMGGSP